MRSTSCGVAWAPAITAAGSPGAMNRRLNTKSATTTMTGMVARIRLTTYVNMRLRCRQLCGLRHVPEERQRTFYDAADVLAPRLIGQEEPSRCEHDVVER